MAMSDVRRPDPVAIVGAGCRLPGARSLDEFWDLLSHGRDAVGEIPVERFDLGRAPADPAVRTGGTLDDIAGFDAGFFGLSAREAVRLDPQHRLLLETTWEAIEDAGLPAEQLAGTRTGVYTSCLTSDYWNRLGNLDDHDMHSVLGSYSWALPAGRIARLLDLRGPTVGVQATCASALVAVHLAGQAIRTGEIDLALVGGVNLLLSPEVQACLADGGILSPRGRCRFGDEHADGYVRGEGAVSIVLRPLSAAVEAGDRIYAVILGSGVASNGNTGDSMAASATTGQADALRQAYRIAGVPPSTVDYVEAHGTGTEAGDAVELTALARVVGEGRAAGDRCLVGSVKSNVGHTEAVSGLTGLLKTALALAHRRIPATLHVQRPNRVLREAGRSLELVRTACSWPDHGRPAVAGVSALGLVGTNAHVVLAEGDAGVRNADHSVPQRDGGRPVLLPVSARGPGALRELAAGYAAELADGASLLDVAFTAGARRTQHGRRIAVAGADRDSLVADLRSFAAGGRPGAVAEGDLGPAERPRVVFVFSGQGSQWTGMGRELLHASPVFGRHLGECDDAIAEQAGWSVVDRLSGGPPLLREDEVQPALWAVQTGLAAMWQDWGVTPDLVIGHSMGEISAATAAGALTTRDAAAVVCRRSALISELRSSGTMLAIALGERDARAASEGHGDRACVAVINSAHSTVLAGEPTALADIARALRRRGVFCREVRVGYASHSPAMEPLRRRLLPALADLRPRRTTVALHSTVRNHVVDGPELDAGYWMANLREPVRFGDTVRSVLRDRRRTLFVEISPHPLLGGALEDLIDESGGAGAVVPSLHRGEPELESLLGAVGTGYVHGVAPNWARLHPGGRFVPLPSYPWQRRRYWIDQAERNGSTAAGAPDHQHDQPQPGPAIDDVDGYFVDRLAELLSIRPETIDRETPLTAVGVDSLLAARLGTTIRRELGIRMPVRKLLGSRTAAEIIRDLRAKVP